MKANLLVWTLILLFGAGLHAQNQQHRISGRIVDAQEKPVDMANVLLLLAGDSSLVTGAITDSLGVYSLEGLAAGDYLLRADLIGYAPGFYGPFQLEESNMKLPPLVIEETATNLDEITVKARKPFIEMRAERLVVNVESSPVAAGNNALEVLAKAPGVTVDNDRNISLRGKQGVLIYIDDKQTYMSPQDVARMLEGMSAGSIETIEIILSPSAKYDAAGNAGVINIRLKRDKSLGFNGTLRLGAGYGNGPKADEGLNINYRSKKIQLYGEYNFWFSQHDRYLAIQRSVPYENGFTRFNQRSDMAQENLNHNYRAGVDFFLGKHTTIGGMLRRNDGYFNEEINTANVLSGPRPWSFDKVDATTDTYDRWHSFLYNLNFSHNFKKEGQRLTIDVDYSGSTGKEGGDFVNNFLTNDGSVAEDPSLVRTTNGTDVDIYAAKLDYSQPLGKLGNLEAGLKSSFVTTNNGIEFERRLEDVWTTDTLLTNMFTFQENIHAAYLNYQVGLGKWQWQAGLRAEMTDNEGYSMTLHSRTERNYVDFFPSLSLSRQFGENNGLSVSYSRRIDRPSYHRLNPFIYFLDQFTYGKGNPYLRPQYADAYNLNYSFKQKYIVSAGYSRTRQVMSQLLEQDDASQQTFQTNRNLDYTDNLSLNMSAPFSIKEWWTLRAQLTGVYTKSVSTDPTYAFSLENWGYHLNLSQEFNLPAGITAELSGFYQSRMTWGNVIIKPQYQLNAGMSMPLWKKRAMLSLNVNDIFNTMRTGAYVRQDNIQLDLVERWESRRVHVNLRYNFGSSEVKAARRRGGASEDETQRAGQ